ncbi:MAG: hypothetical protein HKN18_02035 [Silicimonas sp.]|nr:hypothetical protein [Silicimonas sp.]
MTDAISDDKDRAECFYQRPSLLLSIAGMLAFLLILVLLAAAFGPGFRGEPRQFVYLALACLFLLAGIGVALWFLWNRPVALRISAKGVDLPLVFKHPLAWEDVHRIRREKSPNTLYGGRDWLIVDPSPGVLAPLRLPVWRWLELKWQKYNGVRIPLHGLGGDADAIVASVERFRPVVQSED